MNYFENDFALPIILGNSKEAIRAAKTLQKNTDLEIHIIAKNLSIIGRLRFYFHKLYSSSDEMILITLEDLAKGFEEYDTPILIYSENEFGGFASGAMLAPGMMGVAFVAYVFDLETSAEVPAFIESLENNVDPRWNGCTEAEMTAIGAYDNSVFLIMCPIEIPRSISGKADILEPSVADGSASANLWNNFKGLMSSDNAPVFAIDIAESLAVDALANSTVVEYDWFIESELFTYTVDGYNNAASISLEDQVIYIIQLDDGMDVANWASYYFDTVNADQFVYGAYNNTIILMINVD